MISSSTRQVSPRVGAHSLQTLQRTTDALYLSVTRVASLERELHVLMDDKAAEESAFVIEYRNGKSIEEELKQRLQLSGEQLRVSRQQLEEANRQQRTVLEKRPVELAQELTMLAAEEQQYIQLLTEYRLMSRDLLTLSTSLKCREEETPGTPTLQGSGFRAGSNPTFDLYGEGALKPVYVPERPHYLNGSVANRTNWKVGAAAALNRSSATHSPAPTAGTAVGQWRAGSRMNHIYGEAVQAIKRGDVMSLSAILQRCPTEVCRVDGNNRSLLHVACAIEPPSRVVTELLIKAGVPLSDLDSTGRSPFHVACLNRMDCNHATKLALLRAGCDVNAPTDVGESPAHLLAVHDDFLDSLRFLVAHGADLSSMAYVDGRWCTPLDAAVLRGSEDNVSVRTFLSQQMAAPLAFSGAAG